MSVSNTKKQYVKKKGVLRLPLPQSAPGEHKPVGKIVKKMLALEKVDEKVE